MYREQYSAGSQQYFGLGHRAGRGQQFTVDMSMFTSYLTLQGKRQQPAKTDDDAGNLGAGELGGNIDVCIQCYLLSVKVPVTIPLLLSHTYSL